MVDDTFDSGSVPSHWNLYNGPYGSGPRNCAEPAHDVVSDGALHLKFFYQPTGKCGAGWYSGGMSLAHPALSYIDQRVTVRWRIVRDGVTAHRIIPMLWPDAGSNPYGEADYCEGDSLTGCTTFLHYGSSQVQHPYTVDLTQWHTWRFTRRAQTVTAEVDGVGIWAYAGTTTTLPDNLLHVVLQQECQKDGCPTGTTGSEDIQIDRITVERPAT